MLEVTAAAKEHLATVLSDNGCPEEYAVRLVVDGENLAFTLSTPGEDDETFSQGERVVLAVEKRLFSVLDDQKLDIDDSGKAKTLVMGPAGGGGGEEKSDEEE